MVEHGGGQWNVATKENEVYLERMSEDNERMFEDSLAPEEARQLARLLTKHADGISDAAKASESSGKDSDGKSDDSGKDDESDNDAEDKGEDSDTDG
ncbi:hypothetical protein BST36_17560 [Mycolicibacterium moriokaense]|jgi:hypothetical protein|uniref:Uncharacterized protein n=1 Tax=Mycolicibacterium moriokaense TaxID=39691 RepID=A0AAD1HFB2_9MYCO|nr:hypothetical protein [Mycolicibacterium moriokaense]MCV7037397.1 hypothetical protein [Mycolicibacterium moriokaense]ORB21321.1 hypothetical protein BST36_17560 [Mycolicibacterium moriokaense]BBX04357.1 hypothetical protein MMOR_52930 [Mycolicibacterium moriokaense]